MEGKKESVNAGRKVILEKMNLKREKCETGGKNL